MPAFVLALVLLGALAAGGVSVLNQVRMAPGTLLPAAALAPKSGGKGAPGTVTDPTRQTHAGQKTPNRKSSSTTDNGTPSNHKITGMAISLKK